jgi:hypothetical protein
LYDSWIRNTFAVKFASFIPAIGEMLWQVGIFTGYSINEPDGYMIQLKYCDVFSQRNFEALTKYFLNTVKLVLRGHLWDIEKVTS